MKQHVADTLVGSALFLILGLLLGVVLGGSHMVILK